MHENKLSQQDKEEQVLQAKTDSKGTSWENDGSKRKNKYHKLGDGNKGDSQANGKGPDGHNSIENKSKFDKSKVQCFCHHKYRDYCSECCTNLSKNCGDHCESLNLQKKRRNFSFYGVPYTRGK